MGPAVASRSPQLSPPESSEAPELAVGVAPGAEGSAEQARSAAGHSAVAPSAAAVVGDEIAGSAAGGVAVLAGAAVFETSAVSLGLSCQLI